jgi:hypothetical protein
MNSTEAFNTMPQNAAGLGSLMRPMAQQVQSMGRGDDTMLIHMTPNEVNSLQGLALATGGSLTTNPETGLPEAGWLGKLLPSILGFGLNMFLPGIGSAIGGALGGIGSAAGTGLAIGAGTAALSGDLNKGLMAGLGAFGGASLGGAVKGAGASALKAATPPPSLSEGMQQAIQTPLQSKVAGMTQLPGGPAMPSAGLQQAARTALPITAPSVAPVAVPNIAAQQSGILPRFGDAASAGMTGLPAKVAPYAAGLGLLNAVSPSPGSGIGIGERVDNSYQGPYTAQRRTATFAPSTEELLRSSVERQYFDVDMPEIYNAMGQVVQPGSNTAPGTSIFRNVLNPNAKKNQPMYAPQAFPYMMGSFAKGGEVAMRDGSFVVDARTVSEIGNGSSNAGIERLGAMGGRPVRGDGDGVSDSVPARIGGSQEARVARDEVVFSPKAVAKLGGGDHAKGTKKLYALMERAHAARKKAERGQDTKLRRGLA